MERLFLIVLNRGMAAGYLILAVIIARMLLKKAPKNMICLLWIVVGLRLICPFHIETVFSLLPQQTDTFTEQMHADRPMVQGNTVSGVLSAVPKADTSLTETARLSAKGEDSASKILPAAAWIWTAGILLMCVYLVFSWCRVKKHVATAVPAVSEGIRFYQSDRISSPFLFGLVLPKIYVPFALSGQELSFVLKHEHAHKSRLDYLTKFAGYLLVAVYWFQPLVWAAYLLFCRDIELACDERVVREIGEDYKKAYSQVLLASSVNCRTAAACPVAFGEIGVKNRVKNILNYSKPGRRIILAAAVACMIVTVCFATEAKSGNLQAAAAVTESVAKWAEAYCGRNAAVIYEMLDDTGRQQLMDAGILYGEHSLGWSSPWPWDTGLIDDQPNYRILSADEAGARILYYAWTSDPHVTVWHQAITYQYVKEKDAIVVHDVSSEILDSIHTADQFFTAYPDGEIDGTRMDYVHGNGAGEALNVNALLLDNARIFQQPDTAAVFLLNIQDDPSAVKTQVSDRNGETIVTFTFLEDGSSASVKMIQPHGEHDIWVPQTDTAGVQN